MATLVLTVAGSVIGGPIGGAIGAAIGQQIDAELFKPKGREGPRLSDLKLQTSSYGTQIPALFGTMRVAGTVIWATDLLEHRTRSGGGKGRPSTTQYSYSASFAVALSSRPIVAVRRIWADGNLVRGEDGVLKERGTLRVLTGTADQDVDPAIGGDGLAVAHRDLAIALFEDLDLSAFGNRIPQLSFEVEADSGVIGADTIGAALIGVDHVGGTGLPLMGYAVQGDSISDAVAPLAAIDGWVLRDDPVIGSWTVAPRDLLPAQTAVLDAFRCDAAQGKSVAEGRRVRAAGRETPGAVRLRYYDRDRDYQSGQQQALVAGGGRRDLAVDLPAVADAAGIAAQAARIAGRMAAGRETTIIDGDFASLALPIGIIVDPEAAGLAGLWRVSERHWRDGRIQIGLTRHESCPTGTFVADPGQALSSPDWPVAMGEAVLLDLPPSGDVAARGPLFAVAIGGSNGGWRGADLWWRRHPDVEPVPLGRVAPAAAVGHLVAPLGIASPALFDDRSSLVVALSDPEMVLVNASDAALAAGANRAMVGGESIQFGRALPLGGGQWRLGHLLRARNATEDIAGLHPAGTPFALIDPATLFLLDTADGEAVRGGTIEWAAVGGASTDQIALGQNGRAALPLSPVHPFAEREGASIRIGWVRRSRTGFSWRDQVDVPIAEAEARFRLILTPAAGAAMIHESTEPEILFDRAALAALAGGADIAATVHQLGDYGVSPACTFAIAAALLL